MNIGDSMFKYLKVIFRGAYKILFAYPKIRKYAKNKDKYPIEERYAYARKLIKIVMKAFDIDVKVEGFLEIDKKEPCLYVANHQSFMDSLTLIYLFEDPICFVTKKESRDYPFVGKVCHFIDCIFLDRENLRDSIRMIKECKEKLNNGVNVCIFPEGTRTKDENFMPADYKAGALKCAYDTNKKIVVLTLDGSYKALSTKYKGKLVINVKVSEIIDPSVYKEKGTTELADYIKQKTFETLSELRKQNG